MNIIIYANPKDKGHCATILKSITKEFKSKNEQYEIIDLYKISFDFKLTEKEEWHKTENEQIKKYQEKIKKSNKIIFIYPIWWNNMPAVLKGFMDKVFSAKFAFIYTKIFGISKPLGLLKGKKAAIFITTGSPKILFNLIQKNRGAKVLSQDILRFCGIKNKVFHYGDARKLNEKSILKLEKLSKKGINWLLK